LGYQFSLLGIKKQIERSMNISEFTQYLYDRPVNNAEWYFEDDHQDLALPKDQLVQLATEAFNSVVEVVDDFSEKQICMGLQYLVDPSCGPIPYLYVDTSIDFAIRSSAIASMQTVFRHLFANLRNELGLYRTSGGAPLSFGETCYMWWDMFPRHGVPMRSELEETDAFICRTIGSILEIDSLACQESALHGLGHWFSSRPDDIAKMIGAFLPRAPAVLKEYAMDAMQGRVQ
jgi:hypothetical protein